MVSRLALSKPQAAMDSLQGQRKNQASTGSGGSLSVGGMSPAGASALKQLSELTAQIEEGRSVNHLKEKILRLIQETEHQWTL